MRFKLVIRSLMLRLALLVLRPLLTCNLAVGVIVAFPVDGSGSAVYPEVSHAAVYWIYHLED